MRASACFDADGVMRPQVAFDFSRERSGRGLATRECYMLYLMPPPVFVAAIVTVEKVVEAGKGGKGERRREGARMWGVQ